MGIDAVSSPHSTANGTAAGARRALGPYHIVAEKGTGAFGTVYLAEDSRTGRPVAVRVLPRSVTDEPSVAATLRRRARTVIEASQTHPGLVRVLEYGTTEDGQIFAVMERAEGRRLDDVLADRRPRDMATALAMAIGLGGPLETLHNQGLVHAAVRPANFVVDADDRITLLDVELVALYDVPPCQQRGADRAPAEYLAPEQIEGQPASEKTDVYAFGVLLYQLLSGVPPFEATTREQVLAKHLREAPLLLNQRGVAVPVSVEAALVEALDKVPERRPFMQKVLNQIATNSRVRTGRWKQVAVPAAGLLAAAAIALPVMWMLLAPRPTAKVTQPAAVVGVAPTPRPAEASSPPTPLPAAEVVPAALDLPERPAEMPQRARSARSSIPLAAPPVLARPQPAPVAEPAPAIAPWRPVGAPPIARPPLRVEPREERELPHAVVSTAIASPPQASAPPLAAPEVDRGDGDPRALIDWLLNQRGGSEP